MRNPVERDGLGYRLDSPDDGVSIHADRLREASGEVTAELTIERAPDGHLTRTRLNLLSSRSRAELANSLGKRSNHFDWNKALETLCMGVLALERQGEPWVKVGRLAPREQPPFLLEPWLFERAPTILFGGGGIGKSTVLASSIVVALATGRPTLPGMAVKRTGPVLILDWEGDEDDWNDSIVAICRGLGIEPPEVDYRICRGPLDGQTHAIAERVAQVGAVCVVVDSAERAMRSPRDSGSDDPAKRFYDALRMIPCAALVIDHVSKWTLEHGGDGGPIGSITKYNAARLVWEVRKTSPRSEDGTRHVKLINRKMSKAEERPDLGLAILRQGGVISVWTEDIVPVARRKDVRLTLWERTADVLAAGVPMTAPELVGALSLSGKDPVRQVETAMARHPDIFGHGPGGRLDRQWYVLENAPKDGQIIAFPGAMSSHQDNAEHRAPDAPEMLRSTDEADAEPLGEHAPDSDVPVNGQWAKIGSYPDLPRFSEGPEASDTSEFYAVCIGNHSLTACPDPAHHAGDKEPGPPRGGGTRGERHNSRAASSDERGVPSRGAAAPLRPQDDPFFSFVGTTPGPARDATARGEEFEDPFA